MTPETDQFSPLKIGMISLGCSKNRVNSEQMMYLLSRAGYHVSGETDGSNIVIINTCGFIESAKSEAIETILEMAAARDEGKTEKIVVAGCLPERYKKDIINELPEIDAAIGTGSFDDIVSVIKALEMPEAKELTASQSVRKPTFFGDINATVSETARIITTSPVWAYLKIAEGCDNRCAYCCIPDIRGRYRSRPVESIVKEANKLVGAGIRELIIVAQDVTGYGTDIYGENRLKDLLKELSRIDDLKWIRLHYMYPDKIDDELIDVIAKSDKIIKYLDIPIQHINDDILKKMHRRGSGQEIRELFKRIRERIGGVVLRTSLITGLPGEGEAQFNELAEFLCDAGIERAGVFAYSPEEGTAAALMDRPAQEIALQRAEQLQEIQSKIINRWNKSRVGSVTTVLVESDESAIASPVNPNYRLARSYAESPEVDGYIHVSSEHNIKPDTFMDIRITGIKNGELTGERL